MIDFYRPEAQNDLSPYPKRGVLEMKRLFIAFIIVALVLLGIVVVRRERRSTTPPTFPRTNGEPGQNPFGVMFANSAKVPIAKELGTAYYRTTVFVESWDGTCAECDAATSNGLKLILTIRNNGGRGQPTTPPTDYAAFRDTVGQIIDKYKPEVLVVENEENSATLFYAGTASQYHEELKAACEVAHNKGINCANGGPVSSFVVLMVANDYKENGQDAKAEDYLKRTLRDDLYQQYQKAGGFSSKSIQDQVSKGKELLSGYKGAGSDYINFHWYVADTEALGEAVAFLEKATGLSAMTNEVGQQRNEDSEQVNSVMQKFVDLEIPYVVWFSVDVSGFGGAGSVLDSDGTLRPNGQAFKNFIEDNF